MSSAELLENAKRASNLLKALANENRLIILCCLAEGEKNVGELETMLGIRQPSLSQQLAAAAVTVGVAALVVSQRFLQTSP